MKILPYPTSSKMRQAYEKEKLEKNLRKGFIKKNVTICEQASIYFPGKKEDKMQPHGTVRSKL